jgi:hypothetical protein
MSEESTRCPAYIWHHATNQSTWFMKRATVDAFVDKLAPSLVTTGSLKTVPTVSALAVVLAC